MVTSDKKPTLEKIITKFIQRHGLKYDYSEFIFVDQHIKGKIICPEHGAFFQTPAHHTRGSACKACGYANRIHGLKLSQSYVIERFIKRHGLRYDYSLVNYTNNRNKVVVICSIHGQFDILPDNHLSGSGCKKCNMSSPQQRGDVDTIAPLIAIHGDRYGYDEVEYSGSKKLIRIKCTKHGLFSQSYEVHLRGHGCPSCSNAISKPETAIARYISSLGVSVVRNTRKLIGPKEIDIYVPDHNIAIEFNGLYWHSEIMGRGSEYHINKYNALNSMGITLLTIFEDEWKNSPDVVKAILRHKLCIVDEGVEARHLTIRTISYVVARDFTNIHHIQGAISGSLYVGAYDGNTLVALMILGRLSRQKFDTWELKRFVTDSKRYAGVASKLYSWFTREMNPSSVISFSDNRWFSGGIYAQLHFEKMAIISPDYDYHKHGTRYNKSKFRKSGIKRLLPDFYDAQLSERLMMKNAGYDRIWNCGKIKWVWSRP